MKCLGSRSKEYTKKNTWSILKRALVMGATGQDGSLLSKSLLHKGYEVVGLSRDTSKDCSNHLKLGIAKDICLKIGHVTNYETVKGLIEKHAPDEIYNLAAQSSVGKSYSHPKETIKSIIDGTLNILEVSKEINYNGKLFFAGSSEMYGLTEVEADVNHIQKPVSPYGIAKQASFNLVKVYRKACDLKCVTGVLFNHESSLRNEKFITKKIIKQALKCKDNKNIKFKVGNINIERDWGCAKEYVEGIQIMTRASQIKDQVICTGKATKLKDFIKIVFNKLNLNWNEHVLIDKSLYRKNEIMKSVGDPSQMYKDHKWKAETKINELIDQLIEEEIFNK